jgi:hypothetical protein
MTENDPLHTPELPTAAPTRVCRRCSTQSVTAEPICPQCGASYIRQSRRPSKLTLSVIGAVVLALALVGAILIKNSRDRHNEAVAAAQSRSAAASSSAAAAASSSAAAAASVAAEAASSSAAAKRRADSVERARRKDLITFLEKTIKKDAAKDVNLGIIDGPIIRVDCTPVGGGSSDDLTSKTGAFSCIAVNTVNQ